jgi:hypothetical protein
MNKHLIRIIPVFFILASCQNSNNEEENKKTYKYIEIVAEQSAIGGVRQEEEEPKEITAVSDSAAYLEAFKTFTISSKVSKDMIETYGNMNSSPVKFLLLNEKAQDISKTVYFIDKSLREKEIIDQFYSMGNMVKANYDRTNEEKTKQFQSNAKIDSAKVKELSKFFRQKKDEFSNYNRIWFEPNSAPKYTNKNGLYCYFLTENGMPSNLRFRFQYYAEEWLFFSRIQFSIDGTAYEYIPNDTETDSGDGGKIWEWCDQALTASDKELFYALANANSAKIKIIGRQYHDTKVVSTEQIKDIKRTLDLYNAMGGQY